jgi:hypothetical protein
MMLWIRWAFLCANGVYCVLALKWSFETAGTRFGKLTVASPWVWQLVGLAIVIRYHFSAWHLLWWFCMGYMVMLTAVRIGSRFGFDVIG